MLIFGKARCQHCLVKQLFSPCSWNGLWTWKIFTIFCLVLNLTFLGKAIKRAVCKETLVTHQVHGFPWNPSGLSPEYSIQAALLALIDYLPNDGQRCNGYMHPLLPWDFIGPPVVLTWDPCRGRQSCSWVVLFLFFPMVPGNGTGCLISICTRGTHVQVLQGYFLSDFLSNRYMTCWGDSERV